MPSPASSYRQVESWRGVKAASGRSSYAKWMAGLVVVGLFALLAWLLWLLLPSRLPQTHVVMIATGESHKFVVPPIPFAQEDLKELSQTEASACHFYDFSRFQEATNIQDLGRALDGLSLPAKDVLLVYVSAHGVSENGTAYLLGRDYDLMAPDAGRYAVAELLAQLKQSSAKTKLLVLDSAWVPADPRLGMFVNEFPALVAEEVAQWNDPSLWVVLSCSLLQSPTVLFAQRQSLFGRRFVDGLQGSADLPDLGGNEDGFVSLDELFRFVVVQCGRETAGGQTPVLLHAGQRLDELTQIPVGIPLVRAEARGAIEVDEGERVQAADSQNATSPAAEPQQAVPAPAVAHAVTASEPLEGSASSKTVADDAGTATGDRGDDHPAPATTSVPEAAQGTSSGVEDRPGVDLVQEHSDLPLAAMLQQVWQLRDRLELPPATIDQWCPLEYAPQLWREFNAFLVEVDLRSRAGEAFDQTHLQRQLLRQLAGLRRLEQEERTHTPLDDRSLVVDRLLMSARRFADSPERASFATESPELRHVGESVRYYLRLTYRLPDYVRCYAELIARSGGNSDLADLGGQLEVLGAGLLQFRQQLRGREGERLESSTADDSLVILARSLRETDDALRKMLADLVDFLAAHADEPVNRNRIVGLLLSPVWTAEQRQKLVLCLDRPLSPAPPASLDRLTLPQQLSVSTRQWERIGQLARLQAVVFELAGVSDMTAFKSPLDAYDAALSTAAGDQVRLWQEIRALGQVCESVQLSFRDRVAKDGDVEAARWLDARDASLLASSEQRDYFPQLGILPPRQPDRIEVIQRPPGPLRMDQNEVVVEIEVRASNREVRAVSVAPEYDEKVLRVEVADDRQPLRSGRPVSLQLNAESTALLRLRVNMATGREDGVEAGQSPIQLTLGARTLSVPYTVPCEIPRPNEVDLLIERVDPPEQERRFGRHATELRPLANRTTYFRFSLANLSGQERQVDVALYRIPGGDWAPGRLLDAYGEPFAELRSWLFQSGTDVVLPGIEPLAKTSTPVRLSADARPCEVDFTPQPAPAPVPSADQPAPAEPPPPPPEPAPIDITHGLACVITDVSEPRTRWVKWIEINPLTPREYVEPHVSYDPEQGEISIELRGLDTNDDDRPDRFPNAAELAKKPIEVVWDTADVVPAGAERNDRALIDHPGAVARLNARVPPDPIRPAVIRLSVDDFPRAFVYQLALNRQNTGVDIRRDERWIRLVSLQMQNENRLVRTRREDVVSDAPSGDAETEVLYLQPGEPAAFAVPGKGDAILVGLEVDAPLDAFASRDRNDVIEVGLTRAGFEPTRLHSDRAMRAWLKEVTAAGLAVSMEVSDYTGANAVPVSIAGLKNARLKVQARLQVHQGNPLPHELDIVLDGEAPVLASLQLPPAVKQGQSVPVSIEVTELSGPGKAVFGFVTRRGDELKEDQATVLDKFSATVSNNRWPLAVSLDTATLPPNDYFVKVSVTDRVGKQSDLVAPITVMAPSPLPKDTGKPLVGTIQGVVRFGPTFRPDRITVRISGGIVEPTTTSDGGRFRFENVPAGKYVIEARGPVRGYIRQGTAEVELKQKGDYAREIAIDLR